MNRILQIVKKWRDRYHQIMDRFERSAGRRECKAGRHDPTGFIEFVSNGPRLGHITANSRCSRCELLLKTSDAQTNVMQRLRDRQWYHFNIEEEYVRLLDPRLAQVITKGRMKPEDVYV